MGVDWIYAYTSSKLVFIAMCVLFSIAALRFAKLVLRLYRYKGDVILPKSINERNGRPKSSRRVCNC